jgi:hypothetical protein
MLQKIRDHFDGLHEGLAEEDANRETAWLAPAGTAQAGESMKTKYHV